MVSPLAFCEGGLSSGWSLLRPFIRVVFHQGGLSLDLL